MLIIYVKVTVVCLALTIISRIVSPNDYNDGNEDAFLGFIVASFIPVFDIISFLASVLIIVCAIINKKECKIKQKKETYNKVYDKLYELSKDGRCISSSLINSIKTKYKFILDNSYSHLEVAYIKCEYFLRFLEQCKENNLLNDVEIQEQLRVMAEALNKLLKEFVDDINDTNDKATRKVKEDLKSRANSFINDINVGTETFKEYNK